MGWSRASGWPCPVVWRQTLFSVIEDHHCDALKKYRPQPRRLVYSDYLGCMRENRQDTRSHILSVGRGLTARWGYSGVGLSELLKEAGVPKGSFYHYFPSKEAYGCALLTEFVTEYRDKLSATLAHPTWMPAAGSCLFCRMASQTNQLEPIL